MRGRGGRGEEQRKKKKKEGESRHWGLTRNHGQILFVISQPDVYKSPSSNTYM